MGSRVFPSPETELFFVKMHMIHALAETTSEAYTFCPKYLRLSKNGFDMRSNSHLADTDADTETNCKH